MPGFPNLFFAPGLCFWFERPLIDCSNSGPNVVSGSTSLIFSTEVQVRQSILTIIYCFERSLFFRRSISPCNSSDLSWREKQNLSKFLIKPQTSTMNGFKTDSNGQSGQNALHITTTLETRVVELWLPFLAPSPFFGGFVVVLNGSSSMELVQRLFIKKGSVGGGIPWLPLQRYSHGFLSSRL